MANADGTYTLVAEADFDNDGSKEELRMELYVTKEDPERTLSGTSIATDKPVNAQIFGFQGLEEAYTFTVRLHNTGNDWSLGTYDQAVNTDGWLVEERIDGNEVIDAEEQLIWLFYNIMSSNITVQWYLEGGKFDAPTGDSSEFDRTPVFIENVRPKNNGQNPFDFEVNIQVMVGQRIGS